MAQEGKDTVAFDKVAFFCWVKRTKAKKKKIYRDVTVLHRSLCLSLFSPLSFPLAALLLSLTEIPSPPPDRPTDPPRLQLRAGGKKEKERERERERKKKDPRWRRRRQLGQLVSFSLPPPVPLLCFHRLKFFRRQEGGGRRREKTSSLSRLPAFAGGRFARTPARRSSPSQPKAPSVLSPSMADQLRLTLAT